MNTTLLRNLKIESIRPTIDIGIGSIIKDRFIIEEKIGSGGMGTVYKVRDKRREEANLESPYIAIKILNSDIRHHSRAFAALQHEAAKAQTLSHPNIVRIYDFDRDGELAFITMEYLEGFTLADLLKNAKFRPLTDEQKIKIITQVLEGLQYAHEQNCIHADLKPSNIFVLNDLSVKIIDFGIANAVNDKPKTKLLSSFSPESLHAYSAAYASQETVAGKKPDIKDEIYAIACIIYELLSGQHPYKKCSATAAAEKKIGLKSIPILAKTQWSVLRVALALENSARNTSIKQLRNVFRAKSSKLIWWKSICAVLVIVLMLVVANQIDPFI